MFRVAIKVPNPDGILRSGMTATVAFDEPSRVPSEAVLIPMSALISPSAALSNDPNQLAVFVVNDSGHSHERLIQTGDFVRSWIIVTEGLRSGERVVTAGASTLYDGATVIARAEDPR